MFKWRLGIISLAVFYFFVDGPQSAHCAAPRPSRSVTVPDVATPRNRPDTVSTNVSSRVVVRPVNNPAVSVKARIPSKPARIVSPISARAVIARSSTNVGETINQSGMALMNERDNMLAFCKEQYTKCMDNYCNVLDDKLGRCICSANLKNYTKTEDGLNQAKTDLQNVAQQIQYIGLTADQVETLFSQTEAELELQSKSDNSQLKSNLDEIKEMIIDVQSGRATNKSNSGLNLSFNDGKLLDFSLDDGGLNLTNLFGGFGVNTDSVSNQRGADLYKTAAARCQVSVLDMCQAQGVDISMITGAYDLEIDKACIAYERSLNDANDQMLATVRNARSVLQRARLTVAQQHDSYDLRQCVAELDNCMQDDFVCGSDYESCLDPTGKFIVKGDIVSVINHDDMMSEFWGVSSPSADPGFIAEHVDDGVIELLLDKIGDPIDNPGLCSAVLDKCQSQWKDDESDRYDVLNQVSLAYLETVIPKIIAQQKELMNDFVGNCRQDVNICMDKVAVVSSVVPRPTQSVMDFLSIRIGACRNVIDSCAASLNISTKGLLTDWIKENVCDGYDVVNDVCDKSAYNTAVRNCNEAGNLWVDGACVDSVEYYRNLASSWDEIPSWCFQDISDLSSEQWRECFDYCYDINTSLENEPKPMGEGGAIVYEYQCDEIGWVPKGSRKNSEFFCAFKGCRYSVASRCISGYTRIDKLRCGNATLDWVCCPPGAIDECTKEACDSI